VDGSSGSNPLRASSLYGANRRPERAACAPSPVGFLRRPLLESCALSGLGACHAPDLTNNPVRILTGPTLKQLAPAGTTTLPYVPDASVPSHAVVFTAAGARLGMASNSAAAPVPISRRMDPFTCSRLFRSNRTGAGYARGPSGVSVARREAGRSS